MGSLLSAFTLFLLIGGVLGLLGGGGGILTVPVLVYVVGVEPKPAIAMSLLLVGVTSSFGAALQARTAQVRWKLGGILGLVSMASAFVGGRLAELVPERVLLGGLGTVMILTALAMLKGRSESGPSPSLGFGRVLLIGVAVGMVSGLVGAGGGFLIVPALTLLGGFAMREAIGTSLVVISLQAFAGFAGHASHVALDWQLVAILTSAATLGLLASTLLGKRLSAETLRRAFALVVLATGLFVIGRQLPPYWTELFASAALRAALGGAMIGLAASLFFLGHGRISGISGLFGGVLRRNDEARRVRAVFIAGLFAGGGLLRLLYPEAFAATWTPSLGLALVAGLLVGFGTQLGSGCTSGHGICGLSRLSARSLAATGTFMAAGFTTVFLVRHVFGAGR